MIARFLKLTFLFLPFLAEAQNKIEITPVMNGLSIPVDIVFDYNNRMYVVEKTGKIKTGDISQQTVYLDIDDRVNSGANERGLLGMAFHPDYQANGYVFVNYTGGNGQTVVSRFTRSANDSLKADADSEKILMTIAQPFNNHNAGDLNFGPDGYLYIAMGDGGSGGDPGNRSQNPKERLGKLLRIDVNTDATHYLIPADNPYAGNPDTLGEIWSMGLRNPWRFSFDRATNDLWIADVGQRKWEEINHIPYGMGPKLNFGWRCYEGFEKYDFSLCNNETVFYPPIHVYANNSGADGCSVTGGYVYRGEQNPYLYGYYIYGDFCSGKIWRLKKDDCGNVKNELIYTVNPQELSSFGEDLNGELYFAMLGEGRVYKITQVCDLSVKIDSIIPAACAGANNGAVVITASGSGSYTTTIEGGVLPNQLKPGNYNFKVSDANNVCFQTGCFTIDFTNQPLVCDTTLKDTICGGEFYSLNPEFCIWNDVDSLHLWLDGKVVYTATSWPIEIEIPGIYDLQFFKNDCDFIIDSFLSLDVFFQIPNVPVWDRNDTAVIVTGLEAMYDYYEMYVNDTLYAISLDGYFELPADLFGSVYFIGYASGCPSGKSEILILSSVKGTQLLKPWYFPNPASTRLESDQINIKEVRLLDYFGREIQKWNQPQTAIELKPLLEGNYLLYIVKEDQVFIQQIVIVNK